MRPKAMIIVAALFAAAAGCHKDNKNDALQNDLNLANQANSARSLDSISAVERGYGAPNATSRTTTGTASRSGTARHSTSSGGSVESAPAPTHTVTQRNTNRDAAIGAAAGAIIGATTSRNKVKGGIIGAAAGGILGGVIGNNVDVKKKKVP